MKMRVTLAATCVLFAISHSSAQPATVQATADRTQIQIADPIRFQVSLTASAGSRVVFPGKSERLGAFDVLDQDDRFDIPSDDGNGATRQWIRTYSLETLETGPTRIPSLEVVVKLPDGATQVLRTNPVAIEVASVLESDSPEAEVNNTEFADIAPLRDIDDPPVSSNAWVWWTLGGTSVVVLAGLAFAAMIRRRTITPARWALDELENNRRKGLPFAEKTLRGYLQAQFDFPAQSYSADQIGESLAENGISDSPLKDVLGFLATAEKLKYGGLKLTEAEIDDLQLDVRQLISKLDQESEAS